MRVLAHRRSTWSACALAILAIAILAPSRAQEPGSATGLKTGGPTETRYAKQEVMIPMRDGTKLFTIIYSPKDTSQRYPFLLTRTAYSIAPYGADNYRPVLGPSEQFTREGYIFVYQDARGRFRSEGGFIHHLPFDRSGRPNESTDTYDTIDWLLKNVPDNNGRVGQWGISWDGWETSMGMIDAHPALKASSPQAPPQDQFLGDDYHSGGAYQLSYGFAWMSSNARARSAPTEQRTARFDYGTPDGYRFFLDLGAAANAIKYFGDTVPTWNDHMQHGTYDEYWKSRNVPKDLGGVHHPVLVVAGWFDAEDFYGPFRMYRVLKEKNADRSVLVVGPWSHGAWARGDGDHLGAISFASKTSAYYRTEVELPFFNYYLKDKGRLDLPRALAFETGRNQWRSCAEWPPAQTVARKLYLQAGDKLSFDAPLARDAGFDSYLSDPAKPVPYTAQVTTTEGQLFIVEDQRFAWRRPDVLSYETDPLGEDLTIAGPIAATLHVSTTGTDSDFVVKLVDVYPGDAPDPEPNPAGVRMGGYQMLLAGDILRAKFRDSFSAPRPMVPGKATRIEVPLGDRYHTFLKGHRVMVQIQSSWFPMFDRNPQRFVDIYHAKPSDYVKVTQRVYRTKATPSYVTLAVMR
jgi:putative CocE/NonD family hydrolase